MRERGLKSCEELKVIPRKTVAPVRERGLKFNLVAVNGNWPIVAPVRERGLKYAGRGNPHPRASRSREGAWIEIRNTVGFSVLLTQMTYSD